MINFSKFTQMDQRTQKLEGRVLHFFIPELKVKKLEELRMNWWNISEHRSEKTRMWLQRWLLYDHCLNSSRGIKVRRSLACERT